MTIKKLMKTRFLQVSSVGFVMILWQMLVGTEIISKDILPAPSEVISALLALGTIGLPPGYLLWGHIGHSLFRVSLGFTIASVYGLSLGIMIAIFPVLKALLNPWIELLRPVPPLAWIPLAVMWFGIGNPSAVFVIANGALFPILLNTIVGIESTDLRYLEAAQTLGASKKQIITKVLLPGAAPSIFTGLRVGWQISWMTLVAAEFTGMRSGYGLGYLITIAHDIQRSAFVIAGMVVIGIIGYLSNSVFEWFQTRTLRWK